VNHKPTCTCFHVYIFASYNTYIFKYYDINKFMSIFTFRYILSISACTFTFSIYSHMTSIYIHVHTHIFYVLTYGNTYIFSPCTYYNRGLRVQIHIFNVFTYYLHMFTCIFTFSYYNTYIFSLCTYYNRRFCARKCRTLTGKKKINKRQLHNDFI